MRKAAQLPEQIQDNQPLQSDSISAALWNLDVTMCSIGKEQYSQSLIHGEHHALLQMPFELCEDGAQTVAAANRANVSTCLQN